mmetsp:Transcript_796/g.1288  ORF Transcript_796/g.1288 Transcript_796/m.1288 type:complete len:314 (-) Transcript_796:87-1028(-)
MRSLITIVALPVAASAFGIIDPSILHIIHDSAASLTSASHYHVSEFLSSTSTSNTIASASDAASQVFNPLQAYKDQLATHPLITKMATGGTLAVCGDAIAQSKNDDEYDKRRALSFAGFDVVYRAVQHFAFPAIVHQFHGQYIASLLAASPALTHLVSNQLGGADPQYYFGAMEQTLASQLGIVPFFYYPVFYTITAFVQGLDQEAAVQRAKDTFVPLMKRNLMFWIPVQFLQFGFIDESLQIPFLSVAGLAWTFIISSFAGNAKAVADDIVGDASSVQGLGNITTNDIQNIERQIIRAVERDSEDEQATVLR